MKSENERELRIWRVYQHIAGAPFGDHFASVLIRQTAFSSVTQGHEGDWWKGDALMPPVLTSPRTPSE